MNLQKNKPYKSDKYLDYIRTLDCSVGGCQADAEPHHTEAGGMSMKGSDLSTIPLCREHHTVCHNMGKVSFYEAYNLDRWELIAKATMSYIERGE